jgi:hypothetical protein
VRGCLQRVGYSLRSAQPTRPPCSRVATGARDCSAGPLAGILACTVGALAAHLIAAEGGVPGDALIIVERITPALPGSLADIETVMSNEKWPPLSVEIFWGRMAVESMGVGKDFKLYPGGGRAWDWAETGTRLSSGGRRHINDHGSERCFYKPFLSSTKNLSSSSGTAAERFNGAGDVRSA